MYVRESLGIIISITLITIGFFYKIKKIRKKSKRQIILIALELFFALLIINSNNNNVNSLNNESDIKVKLSTLHQPIHINNNWSDAKAAGICTGSGIYSDPYIIEDYIIDSGGAGTCIDIENSEVYFIIQNCTLYNSGSYPYAGIKLVNITNGVLIINNCSFNNGQGIYLSSSHNNSVLGNNVNDNLHGILLQYSSNNNTISGNTANNNIAKGIYLLNSHNNTISGNTANKNDIGIRVDNGNSNKILENNVNNNSGYTGVYISDSNNTIVSRNNASYSGWYGMLLQNSYNNSISANILKYNGDHGLYLTNSHNNIIKDMIVDGGGSGSCILIENTDKYFRIENCTVYNSAGGDKDAGIKLNYADNGLLINNNCSFNIGDGIRLENSNDNMIMENIANNNKQYGIKLRRCVYNTISENEANYNGIVGIHLHWSNNNNVSGNVANYNGHGIWLAGNCPAVPCDYNTISKNVIINNNNYGIVLGGSDYNTVWENLFIDNKKEIQGHDNCLNNNWDNGTVGNYWDDYKDRYPSATNNGFIWDTPYEIDGSASSQDNYPLFLPTVYFLFINFEISDQYLNTTMPLETDLGLKISCYVINSTTLSWVYLCENSTGVFVNHSMNEGINGFWSYNLDISGLDRGDKLMFSFYTNDSEGNIGRNDNNGLNFSILIGDYYAPIITFEISDTYLSTTRPLETDLSLEINCSVSDISTIEWVYLCENSTGVFVNRSMSLGVNGEWTYTVDISALVEDDILMFSFSANDSYNNIGYLNNGDLNFSILIGDYYREPIYINGNDDFTSQNGVMNPWAAGTEEDSYIIENWIIDAGGTGSGIEIRNSDVYFIIQNCTLYNSGDISIDAGIKLGSLKNGILVNNYCFNNKHGIRAGEGVAGEGVENCIINRNNCSYNNDDGIILVESSNNTIFKNNCSSNGRSGISLFSSSNNIISKNKCFNNSFGIHLTNYTPRPTPPPSNNTISANIIKNNGDYGLLIFFGMHNDIYYNIFINNSKYNAMDNGTNNEWDNGTIGNYWGDYEEKYPDAWNDGYFWDTPYAILGSANSYDNHPIDNFLEEDPQYFDIKASPTVYSVNGIYNFNCTWLDDDNALSEVYLKFNGTYYLVTENYSGEFSYTLYNLPANESGYSYQWLAKDHYNAWNATPISYFILQKASAPLLLLFNGTEGDCAKYSHQYVNISLINENEFPGEIFLYINSTLIEQSSLFLITHLSKYSVIGIYNVTGLLIHPNYTGRITYWMTIDDIISPDIIFDISPFYLNTTTPQYYQTGLQINCTVQDDTSIIWVYLCENSTGIFVNRSMLYVNGNYTFNLDISSLNWGNTIMFSFYAKDSAGNIKWDNNGGLNYSIQIYDFQDPITTLDFQIVESPNFISNSTLFTLNSEDGDNDASGIYNISYRIDSGIWTLYTSPFSLSGYSHGIHTIYYYATDNAGNAEVINQEIVFLDIQSPNIIFEISPFYLNTTTPQYNQTGLQINCTIQDDTSLIWVYICENSTGTFINHSMSYMNGNYTFNLDISSLNWGNTIMFSFYAMDSAGNIKWDNNDGINYSIQIYDFQDPITVLDFQIVESPNFISNSTLFTLSTNDDILNGSSGVYNISYRIDSGGWILYTNPFNLAGYTHGIHTIYYYATDNAGNTEEINQEIVFLDIQSPNITFDISLSYLNTTTPQYYQTGLQINCTIQDDTSLIWVYICENSTGTFINHSMSYMNGNYTFNLDISSLNWGNTIMFSFYAMDSAGNIKWDNNDGINYSIQIYDFQDPITVLDFDLSFNPNFVNISTLFSLSAEDNISIGGSGVKTISYKIDGDGWNIYSVPFNLNGYSEGIHIIYYYATDYAGNIETTKQITVYLDKNNLTTLINFTCYEDSSIKYVNNFTQFTINWNDGTGSGLQNIYYKIDSESFSVYSTPFALLGYSEGLHTITFYSIDNVGNIEPEKSIQIYLDISALELEIIYDLIHDPNYIDEYTEISITSIEDLGSGVKNVQYRIDEGIWINGTELNLNGLTLGEHTIYYRVEDNVGNFREKSEIIFLVTENSDLDGDGLTYSEEKVLKTDSFDEDTDDDGMLDGWEVSNSLNPLIDDSGGDLDSDNLSNLDEYTNNTDPNDSDTDDDGMPDGWEVSNSLNPLINDSSGDLDSDNLSNLDEYTNGTDPNDSDTDGDKLLDGDEVNIYHTNPLSRDTDGDGYSDYDEIIEYGTDPNNALSSPIMNIIIFIIIFSTITISGYVGVKKWKVVHRKRVEDEVITRILEDKNKVLEHNVLNERLQKVKSKLNFENIVKKRDVNGQYILNGALFVKDIGIEKFETLIKNIVKKIYDQNLSKREDVNLIKLNIKDLEQDEKLMEFIKKLKGERV